MSSLSLLNKSLCSQEQVLSIPLSPLFFQVYIMQNELLKISSDLIDLELTSPEYISERFEVV